MTISSNPLTMLFLLPWAALWLVGGVWLARAAFRLRPNEVLVVGITLGFLVQNWLANLLVYLLPVPLDFWASAALVLLAGGLALARRDGWRALLRFPFSAWQAGILAVLVLVYFSISRGMAIFDDFAHLPTVSIMATGDIPPHFSLDPAVLYGYHHFLLLFSAQTIRVGSLLPWVALDAGRALAFGLAVMLAALFTQRLTRSALAGLAGGALMAFGSGTRWLLLLVPRVLLLRISPSIQMIGSGAGSGPSLADALMNAWAVEGAGPQPFPFAFANGILPPGVISAHTANSLVSFALFLILLLTFNRWRSGLLGAVLSAVLISIWGLLGEAELPGILLGWGIVAIAYAISRKTLRLPRSLWTWLGVAVAGCLVGFLEGGALTDILVKTVERLTGHVSASYQTIGFVLGAPAVVSSHLGVLPVYRPAALLVALLELGPVLLVFPLLAAWGLKAFRLRRWYEAAAAATAFAMLLMLFVQFSGSTGVRNTPRLYVFLPLLVVFAAPLAWNWAARRSMNVRALVAVLGLVTMLGGVVMFGVELLAAQRPVYSSFLTTLDARMLRAHWNRLEPGALVFDPQPSRATTLFGRATDAAYTWYQVKPQWQALATAPDPRQIHAAGFRYIYLDNKYWDGLTQPQRQALSAACVRKVDEVTDTQGNFRRLLDISACQ